MPSEKLNELALDQRLITAIDWCLRVNHQFVTKVFHSIQERLEYANRRNPTLILTEQVKKTKQVTLCLTRIVSIERRDNIFIEGEDNNIVNTQYCAYVLISKQIV